MLYLASVLIKAGIVMINLNCYVILSKDLKLDLFWFQRNTTFTSCYYKPEYSIMIIVIRNYGVGDCAIVLICGDIVVARISFHKAIIWLYIMLIVMISHNKVGYHKVNTL